jgi:O-antigen ligase
MYSKPSSSVSSFSILIVCGALLSRALQPVPGPAWRRRIFGLLAFLVLVAILFSLAWQIEYTRTRMDNLLATNSTAYTRVDIWNATADGIAEYGVSGLGIGSSGLIALLKEDQQPHNLFLQIWLEGGLVGVILLVIYCALPLLALLARTRRGQELSPLAQSALALYVLYFLELNKSGDFYTARTFIVLHANITILLTTRAGHAKSPATKPTP